jgi:cutinase
MKISRLLAGLLIPAALTGIPATSAHAAAAASCGGTYTVVVGGRTDTTAAVFGGGVTERVHYSAALNSESAREGVNELNRLIRDQRAACPGQHAKAVGFSEGAAVVHIWVTENWQTFGNVNAVLVADPKRAAGPGAAGLAGQPYSGIIGAPLAGSDISFGNIPTVTICTDDVICDSTAASGWIGYLQGRHVANYADATGHINVDNYSDDGAGQWFNGQYIPA